MIQVGGDLVQCSRGPRQRRRDFLKTSSAFAAMTLLPVEASQGATEPALQRSATTDETGVAQLTAELRGRGQHEIVLQLFNCESSRLRQTVTLERSRPSTLRWQLPLLDKLKPWVAVVVPNAQPDLRQEAFGSLGKQQLQT